MPWHIQQGGGSCGSSEWAVIKDSDNSTAGCHPTKAEAEAQMAALYANEPSMNGAASIAARRAEFYKHQRAKLPQFEQRGDDPKVAIKREATYPGELRAAIVERDGKELRQLDGYASITDKPYKMQDWIGEYDEIVDGAAFDETLATNPDVAFLVNHRGVTMARTTNGTLELEADGMGLRSRAFVNPERQDVRDLVTAIDDRNITEMSFGFFIEDGEWSKDFNTYTIKKVSLDRGDVSAVNYGANPSTSIGVRQRELFAELGQAPTSVARAAVQLLQRRPDVSQPGPQGRSVALEKQLLLLDES